MNYFKTENWTPSFLELTKPLISEILGIEEKKVLFNEFDALFSSPLPQWFLNKNLFISLGYFRDDYRYKEPLSFRFILLDYTFINVENSAIQVVASADLGLGTQVKLFQERDTLLFFRLLYWLGLSIKDTPYFKDSTAHERAEWELERKHFWLKQSLFLRPEGVGF